MHITIDKAIPDNIDLCVLDSNGCAIEDLVLYVKFGAILKNDLYFLILPNDFQNGACSISKERILSESKELSSLYLMDFIYIESNFNGKIDIGIYDKKRIHDTISAYNSDKEYYKFKDGFLDNLKKAEKKIEQLFLLKLFDSLKIRCTIRLNAKTIVMDS